MSRAWRDKRSIVINERTFRGVSVVDRGVFTGRGGKDCETYAGQITDGFACGLGVLAFPGSKTYAEYGPDGRSNGRYLDRAAFFTGYIVFERGVRKQQAWVFPGYECDYNDEDCGPDDPRLLALKAHVAPVEALANAAAEEAKETVARFVTELPRRLAGLDMMITVLLARYRQPPTVASELAEKLLTLPSGVLAVVVDAMVR